MNDTNHNHSNVSPHQGQEHHHESTEQTHEDGAGHTHYSTDRHGHDDHVHHTHGSHREHEKHAPEMHDHSADHRAHTDHTGHEQPFRPRFWVSFTLSIPVIYFSEFIQGVFGYTAPTFPGSVWITPVLSVVIFAYGGLPFLSMPRTELEKCEPGMMMLISLAITVLLESVSSWFLRRCFRRTK